MFEELME